MGVVVATDAYNVPTLPHPIKDEEGTMEFEIVTKVCLV
jgi:hypothetical protein